jgi:hypothetical protein
MNTSARPINEQGQEAFNERLLLAHRRGWDLG